MREFWRRVTGPKRGVYSLRPAQSAHRNASTNPSHHRIQIPRAAAADRIGSVDYTSGGTLLVPTEHGGRRPAALRQWIAPLLSICASTLRFARLQSLQRIGMPPAIPGRFKLRRA